MYGFYIVFGEFGSGKTRNVTTHLKYADKNTINISNYYTGYTHMQVETHNDIFNLFLDLYDFMFYYRLIKSGSLKKVYQNKSHTFVNYYNDLIKFLDRIGLKNLSREVKVWGDRQKSEDYILFPDAYREKEYSKQIWANCEELVDILKQSWYLDLWNVDTKFNIILDEASIYFNNREFSENFKWPRKAILEYIYQVRKFNVLFFCIVQNPAELDTKFRRLAMYFRKYYHGIFRWQWWRDFYFVNPDEMDLEKAEQVGWGMFSGAFFNLYPYQKLDYLTTEGISIRYDVYAPWSVFYFMNKKYKDLDEKDLTESDNSI